MKNNMIYYHFEQNIRDKIKFLRKEFNKKSKVLCFET